MQIRNRNLNASIEAMRSIATIQETGSITKAANLLGLSQPAISAQVKRVEAIVGGSIFQKTPNGSVPTDLGRLVLSQAHKILEASDQLLLLRGAASSSQAIRIGTSELYTKAILACVLKNEQLKLSIYADSSAEILKALLGGYVDIAVFFSSSDLPADSSFSVLNEHEEELVWVRARDFVLSPGAPIPLVTWPGQITHSLMIEALERNGMIYRLAFTSPDIQSALEAASAGMGVLSLPKEFVPASLMIANDYYLPQLKPIRLLLAARSGIQVKHNDLVDRLAKRLFKRVDAELIAS